MSPQGATGHRPSDQGRPITKTSYALNKLLTSLAKQHATRERVAEEELAGHELTADERAALQAGDITRLYHLGANPYLIRRVFRPRFKV